MPGDAAPTTCTSTGRSSPPAAVTAPVRSAGSSPRSPSPTRSASTRAARRSSSDPGATPGDVSTSTDRAVSSPCTLRASAERSRAIITASERSVGSMSNTTVTTPSSRCWRSEYPASRNTAIIRPFCGSTSAVNRRTPRSRAAAARCSSSTEPRPRPWCASAMLNATSASSGPTRSYRATPMIASSPVTATSATRSR